MRVRIVAATLAVLFVTSCAPRFTVYIGVKDRMNTDGVTLLSVDTVKVAGSPQRRIQYTVTRDIGGLERLFLKGKIKRMKKELDNVSR